MLESRVDTFYQRHGISRPADISLLLWEEIVHVDVLYRPGQTDAATIGNQRVVFMDARKPLADRRAELAHEIGHALLHAGNQLTMSNGWRLKQEWQANHFAYYALVPTYLLLPLIPLAEDCRQRLVVDLAEVFCVPVPFMSVRLDLLQRRLDAVRSERVAEMTEIY